MALFDTQDEEALGRIGRLDSVKVSPGVYRTQQGSPEYTNQMAQGAAQLGAQQAPSVGSPELLSALQAQMYGQGPDVAQQQLKAAQQQAISDQYAMARSVQGGGLAHGMARFQANQNIGQIHSQGDNQAQMLGAQRQQAAMALYQQQAMLQAQEEARQRMLAQYGQQGYTRGSDTEYLANREAVTRGNLQQAGLNETQYALSQGVLQNLNAAAAQQTGALIGAGGATLGSVLDKLQKREGAAR